MGDAKVRGRWPAFSLAIAMGLFLQAAIRAATQSITIDEAMNYTHYLNGPLSQVFLADYDANNQVLQTLLSWLTCHWMGPGELAQRIPTLGGCGLYLWSVLRISRLLFGRGAWHTGATVVLAGNPYVLDFFTVARGYGLALALLSMAVAEALEVAEGSAPNGRFARIGVWCGFAVASNLAWAFPVAGLLCALAAARRETAGRLVRITLPASALPAAAILILPLRTATRGTFIFGAESWRVTMGSLLSPTMEHNGWSPAPQALWTAAGYAVPVCAAAVAIFAFVLAKRGERRGALACAVPTVTIALLGVAHGFGLKLPIMRTGIYLLFLMPLGLLAVARARGPVRWAAYPVLLFFGLVYVAQWNPAYVSEWAFDAGTRGMVGPMEAVRANLGRDRFKVGGSWLFVESLNYYRVVNGYVHWLPVERGEADAPADIYLLMRDDANVADRLKLKVLLRDRISGSVLAAP